MITDLKEIENSALKLDRKDKVHLAEKLLQGVRDRINPEIEQEFKAKTVISETSNQKLLSLPIAITLHF